MIKKEKSFTYCGRHIQVFDDKIVVSQSRTAEGVEDIPISYDRLKMLDAEVTEEERTDYRIDAPIFATRTVATRKPGKRRRHRPPQRRGAGRSPDTNLAKNDLTPRGGPTPL